MKFRIVIEIDTDDNIIKSDEQAIMDLERIISDCFETGYHVADYKLLRLDEEKYTNDDTIDIQTELKR